MLTTDVISKGISSLTFAFDGGSGTLLQPVISMPLSCHNVLCELARDCVVCTSLVGDW